MCAVREYHKAAVTVRDVKEEKEELSSKTFSLECEIRDLKRKLQDIQNINIDNTSQPTTAAPSSNLKTTSFAKSTPNLVAASQKNNSTSESSPPIKQNERVITAYIHTNSKEIEFKLKIENFGNNKYSFKIYCDEGVPFAKIKEFKSRNI